MTAQATHTTGSAAGALVRACHPGPTVAVTTLAVLYGVSLGLPPSRWALVGTAVLAGQLSIGWANDLVDAERDRRVRRTDKPLATGELAPTTVRVACAVALVAAVGLSLACGLLAGLVHLVGVAAGWAYDLGVKATLLSWLPYAVAFAALPAFVSLAGAATTWPPGQVMAAGALLGVGAHLLNALPDLADDALTGVQGLPHRLGRRWAPVVAVLALSGATLLLALTVEEVAPGLRWAATAVVAGLAGCALAAHGRWPFRAAIGIAAVDVVLLVMAA